MASPLTSPLTQGQVIRSEWIKLRTVRSSWFVLGATVLGIAVIGLLVSYVDNARWSSMNAGDRADFSPINQDLIGVNGQALLGSHGSRSPTRKRCGRCSARPCTSPWSRCSASGWAS